MGESERANRIGCAEFRRNLALDRRGFVKAGALGLGGLSLANLMRLEAGVKNRKKVSREKSVIILWKRGGPSQHETWDPKPDAPKEYRGLFGAMRCAARPLGLNAAACGTWGSLALVHGRIYHPNRYRSARFLALNNCLPNNTFRR